MTKPREIVKKIRTAAKRKGLTFEYAGEGGRHTHYRLDGILIPIPRHAEVDNDLAEIIYRECQDKLGKGWWRK